MTNYSKGANFERRTRRWLEERGWVVFRSAGSHSPADLIALKAGEVRLVQCKMHGKAGFSDKDRVILKSLADDLLVGALFAWRDGRKLMIEDI